MISVIFGSMIVIELLDDKDASNQGRFYLRASNWHFIFKFIDIFDSIISIGDFTSLL